MRRLAVLAVFGALAGYYAVIPALRVWQATRLPDLVRRGGSEPGPPAGYAAVEFPSADGVELRGWYRESGNRAAVVLTHGFGGDRRSLLSQAETLAAEGFGILVYDLRSHGTSGGHICTRGWQETDDVLAAVAWLSGRADVDADRIGAFGSSIGAQATLRAATQSRAIHAVVADGPVAGVFADEPAPFGVGETVEQPARWIYYQLLRLAARAPEPPPLVDSLARVEMPPVLLISTGTGHEQRQLRRFAASIGPSTELCEIPESGHTGGIVARPEEYRSRLRDHFARLLVSRP
jgi:pimeloyl-ACP methyl ester carboxylesterase